MNAPPRLSPEQRRQVATELAGGVDARELARKFGVSWSTIYSIGRAFNGHRIAPRRNPAAPHGRGQDREAQPRAVEPVAPESMPAVRQQSPLVGPGFVQPSLNNLIIIDAREGLCPDEICARRNCNRSRVDDVLRRACKFEFIAPVIAQRLNLARSR
ncbi:helix-turn-helix domain-containing protein [Methylosinus sp.]|jgi:transposase-like protein|uniref:helix-turn-helix domain-containing protein n=1 Tax=Methylosinus sp. TaxID=427 RepID=UPI0039C91093